ncbi:hypothetical protein CAPTEDRAFT_149983 [Capitella teleta]|uniref:Anti-silencing function protein 1 n=1 Tax=Capitella teleta TaxID=283909 RepID=R7VGS8_CAPTE|nr:hypothetical protein CAPTEDRAFT_149983 [Capitella teleta]|eukprot:ELU15516.1 hypothetical protein CAPTEDRAFT_149983 [Capitella teleta]
MAKVNICNVVVKDNPGCFTSPFQFEITFECIEDLNDDLEWKIIYVGSAESEEYDQTLDSVVVGPIIAGKHMFVFEACPPDPNRIPKEDAVGVTVVLLTCSYKNREFIRVGYYVNNEYNEDQELKENPPNEPQFDKLQRNILATCPRVTRFKIDWGDGEGSENVAPVTNTENESNQMAIDASNDSKNFKEETNDAPGKMDAMNTSSIPNAPMVAGASFKDCSSKKSDANLTHGSSSALEPMQM